MSERRTVDAPPGAEVEAHAPAPKKPAEPRQRWRIVCRVGADANRTQREHLAAWEAALDASGLPVLGSGRSGRGSRLTMGAPLPAGISGDREVYDLVLGRRETVDAVRAAMVTHLPDGHELVELHDVWLGAPPLPAQVVAAQYCVRVEHGGPSAADLETAARRLLETDELPRERPKGSGSSRYDLRPLVEEVRVVQPGPPAVLRIRTRFDPQLGAGRPAEVLAALSVLLGREVPVAETVRERLIIDGEGGAV